MIRQTNMSWLISLADLLALMLTFFVLLFSMRTIPQEDWRAVIQALRSELRMPPLSVDSVIPTMDAEPTDLVRDGVAALSLDYLKALIRDADLAQDPAAASIHVRREHEQLILSLPLALVFVTGQTELRPQARDFFARLTSRLERLPNALMVRIVDDSDQPPGSFPSIWDRALAQAARVEQSLRNSGYTEAMAVAVRLDAGLTAVERSLPPDRQSEHRRRVDIMLLNYRRGSDDVAGY